MNANAMPLQRNTRWYMSDLYPEKGHQPPNQKDSSTHKLCFSILCLLVFAYVPNSQATDRPVLGTIGSNSSGALTTIQSVAHGSWLGGWNLGIDHTVVAGKIGDFDGDGYDDFVIRSAWGIGVIGNDAKDKLIAKALTPYGTNIGQNWILSEADEVVAVGRFGSASNPAQMVLKGTNGFAFVRAYQAGLQALTVVPYNSWIFAGGVGWRVGPGDKIIGVGRLNGGGDCLVVTSGWGMGVWVPAGSSATPTLLSIHPNGTTFRNPNGRTWRLDTTDPRFRFLGASDIDKASDNRAEMVLVSSSGLAILHKKATGVWGESLDLHFALKDGESFPGASVNSTLHWLIKVTDFNKSGGADLLFQHPNGITVLKKSSFAWSFSALANHVYGPWIGGVEL